MLLRIFPKKNFPGKLINDVVRPFSQKITIDGSQKPKCLLLRLSPNLSCGCYGSNTYSDRLPIISARHSRRNFCTSTILFGVNVRPMTINSTLAADRLIRDMTEIERGRLKQALNHLEQELELECIGGMKSPTMRQLSLIAIANAIPFIGFGFLDNAIMIVAGEYIDCTVGCALGISTMAAAAIGNLISDVAGIGLAGYVEGIAGRFGVVEEPNLTAAQLMMKSTRIACHSGRAIGIIIGCIIGMFPLMFIENDDHEHRQKDEE